MATTYKGLTLSGFLLRFAVAFLLVFSTYNPSGYSYYHWLSENIASPTPLLALAGVVLLIGWAIFLRATSRSLGFIGLSLAAAFFGILIWAIVDAGWLHPDSVTAFTYIFLVILCAILAIGISWSHIRRRMTGQVDVDEVDGDL